MSLISLKKIISFTMQAVLTPFVQFHPLQENYGEEAYTLICYYNDKHHTLALIRKLISSVSSATTIIKYNWDNSATNVKRVNTTKSDQQISLQLMCNLHIIRIYIEWHNVHLL